MSSEQAWLSGLSMTRSWSRILGMAEEWMPGYGTIPLVKISQQVTPNDHWWEKRWSGKDWWMWKRDGELSNHVTLLWKHSMTDAFWSHPLHWQPHCAINYHTNIYLCVELLRETKVSNFDDHILLQPVAIQWQVYRKLQFSLKLYHIYTVAIMCWYMGMHVHTCSFVLQGPCHSCIAQLYPLLQLYHMQWAHVIIHALIYTCTCLLLHVHTCSFVLQGLCVLFSWLQDIPFPVQLEDTSPAAS